MLILKRQTLLLNMENYSAIGILLMNSGLSVLLSFLWFFRKGKCIQHIKLYRVGRNAVKATILIMKINITVQQTLDHVIFFLSILMAA
jgi:hypothetical protein